MNSRPLMEEIGAERRSSAREYSRIFVGRPGLWPLLRYEAFTGLGGMPGALGYFLRARLYRRLLGQCGRKAAFGRGVALRSPGNIRCGERLLVDDLVVLDAKGEGSAIELGHQILISRGCILSCNRARIRFGDYVSVGPFCYFGSRSELRVGSNVSVGPGTMVLAGGHALDDPDMPAIRQERVSRGILIEDGVWLGAGTTVLDGAVIGRNSVIGAGAVVKGEIPPDSVAGGIPARVLYGRKEGRPSADSAGGRGG